MFNAQSILSEHFPSLYRTPVVNRVLHYSLRVLFKDKECSDFLYEYADMPPLPFCRRVLEYFNFRYRILASDKAKIPARGRVIIYSNHPIGTLDGILLLDLVGSVRSDVKVMANDVLSQIKPLDPVLLPVNNLYGGTVRENMQKLHDFLEEEEGALIVFPAGEVSRLGMKGLQDPPWNSGFLRLAKKTRSPVLPISIEAKNSKFFYALSFIAKTLSTLWLVREMFKHENDCVDVKVGDLTTYYQYQAMGNTMTAVSQMRESLYKQLHRKGPRTELEPIIDAQDPELVRRDVRCGQLLGAINKDIQVYLCRFEHSPVLMRELGRLREISFRAVGEGTGKSCDINAYDEYYMHVILWDDKNSQIAGAYRLADAGMVLQQKGINGLYSAKLFDYQDKALPIIAQGLELGRSFVQPSYWGQRSLDFLWYGIGAFLRENPQYKYLFGPVSMSDHYTRQAKDLLLCFYSNYFLDKSDYARPNKPYRVDIKTQKFAGRIFSYEDIKQDFKVLKSQLKNMQYSVPTLYKQYTELTEPGGAAFWAFNIDTEFGNCVDGLVVLDIDKIKRKKRLRYMGTKSSEEPQTDLDDSRNDVAVIRAGS